MLRSEASKNWRRKDSSPRIETINSSSASQTQQNEASLSISKTKGQNILRAEDDPQTLKAITEGRRLYFGNLAYIARIRDVEALFVDNGYNMYAAHCVSIMSAAEYERLRRTASTSTCQSILSHPAIPATALLSSLRKKPLNQRWSTFKASLF